MPVSGPSAYSRVPPPIGQFGGPGQLGVENIRTYQDGATKVDTSVNGNIPRETIEDTAYVAGPTRAANARVAEKAAAAAAAAAATQVSQTVAATVSPPVYTQGGKTSSDKPTGEAAKGGNISVRA